MITKAVMNIFVVQTFQRTNKLITWEPDKAGTIVQNYKNVTKAKLGKYVPKKRQAKYTIKSETGILRSQDYTVYSCVAVL